jgi:hypothetical protein
MQDRTPKFDRARPGPTPAPRPAEPAPEHPILTLQRKAGNQAVTSMLESATDAGDVLRRTGEPAVAAASAPAPPTPPVDPSTPAPTGPALTEGDRAAIADPNAYFRSIGGTWDAARKKYKSGALGWVPGGDDKGKRAASGLGMNALLAFRLQSTVVKKKDDAASNSPMEQVVPAVEKKQWEEHAVKQKALQDSGIQNAIPPPKPLAWNYGAGSGTATSDIDVNLSGDSTEYAVESFNALFRGTWGKEAGTVFDVNIYARDYLPESGAGSLAIAGEKEADASGSGAGALGQGDAAWGSRGVSFETTLQEGTETAKKASGSQEVYSLLKTRKDMSFIDWQKFKLAQMAEFGADTAGRDAKQAAFTEAEAMYTAREQQITAEVAKLDAKARLLVEESKKKGETPPAQDSEAEKRIKAENALYEAKLKNVATVRAKLAVYKEMLLAGQKTVAEVEVVSAELQEALHEASSYANEAYITSATVLHVVGNLQLLKGGEKLSIGLSGADYLASANEQVGFIFDDLHREATIEGGLLKAGKYISRLGHAGVKAEAAAAKKAAAASGKPPTPLASPSCAQVEKYGKALMDIKEKIRPADQNAALGRASADGWTLSGLKTDAVKAAILKFQSKIQTLAGKV